jgi:four helix bundle protein
MKTLKCYQLSVTFYKNCRNITLPAFLKTQLLRAASSATLNIAEGHGRSSTNDRKHFYSIAYGSIKECQAIFDLHDEHLSCELIDLLDHLAASTYLLIKRE